MYDPRSNNPKRITAGIIGFVVLFVIVFSSVYIARESDHDCHGEECPICACLHQCEDMLHQLGSVTAGLILIAVSYALLFMPMSLSADLFVFETPVSKKVRLNN